MVACVFSFRFSVVYEGVGRLFKNKDPRQELDVRKARRIEVLLKSF